MRAWPRLSVPSVRAAGRFRALRVSAAAPNGLLAMDGRRSRPPLAEGGLLDALSETVSHGFEMAFLELELIPVWALYIGKGNGWVTVCDIHLIHAEGITGNPFRVCLAGESILVNAVHAGGAETLRAHFI